MVGACMAGGHAWWEGACMAGGHAWQGACIVGGHAQQRGVLVAGETATAAEGTHPTGMHSCIKRFFHSSRTPCLSTM